MGSNQSISGPPWKWFFQITFFGTKNHQNNSTFCWFLKFYLNICAQVRPALKNLISGLPGSVEKLQQYWKLHYFFMRYFYCLKHHKSGEMWPFSNFCANKCAWVRPVLKNLLQEFQDLLKNYQNVNKWSIDNMPLVVLYLWAVSSVSPF